MVKQMRSATSAAVISLAALSYIFTAMPAFADTWTLDERSGSGSCYKNDKRAGSQKYCHNCGSAGGNNVRWTFSAKCNGRASGTIEAQLGCSGAGDESAQHKALVKSAKASLPPSSQACP